MHLCTDRVALQSRAAMARIAHLLPRRTVLEINEMNKRKQNSGYQNRKRAREKREALAAQGILMPRITDLTLADVSSLTALTSTRLRFLTEWLKKKLSTEDFGVFVKTLSEFRAEAVARIAERQVEADEKVAQLLEQHESRMAGAPLLESPPTVESSPPGPALVGELVPRTDGAEVQE
jgi:hypothetical protein